MSFGFKHVQQKLQSQTRRSLKLKWWIHEPFVWTEDEENEVGLLLLVGWAGQTDSCYCYGCSLTRTVAEKLLTAAAGSAHAWFHTSVGSVGSKNLHSETRVQKVSISKKTSKVVYMNDQTKVERLLFHYKSALYKLG